MFPAYIDPVVPGLAAAFTIAMRPVFLGVAAAALAGVATVVLLVVVETRRAQRPRRRRRGASIHRLELRRAA